MHWFMTACVPLWAIVATIAGLVLLAVALYPILAIIAWGRGWGPRL